MSQPRLCPRCGRPNLSTSSFCSSCGENFPRPDKKAGRKLILGTLILLAGVLWGATLYTQTGGDSAPAQPPVKSSLLGAQTPSTKPTAQPQAEPPKDVAGRERQAALATKTSPSPAPKVAAESEGEGASSNATPSSARPARGVGGAAAGRSVSSSSGDYYMNKDGVRVRRPVFSSSGVPEGATAQCRDGSYSFSLNRRGTCSGHGGVARWL